MLIFHEGLPGSGKSYAAMVDHIIPSLLKGRQVFAYIEGLNHEKIAEAAGLEVETVKALLHQITREQVPTIYDHVENDSLVVIDELQNFWPSGRSKLDPKITEFVTEHRHRGLDVLCMGQALPDCHNLWRRRIDNKIVFMKLDALGSAQRYRWTMNKQVVPDKWEKTTSGIASYDEKYFGCYASHTEGTNNTEHYKDSRAIIWNSGFFKIGAPAALAVGALALWYVFSLFGEDSALAKQAKATSSKSPPAISSKVAQPAKPNGPVPVSVVVEKLEGKDVPPKAAIASNRLFPQDPIKRMMSDYRVRLAGVVLSSKTHIMIEWRDASGRVMESLKAEDLEVLGWNVLLNSRGSFAVLTNGDETHLATAWPLDEGRGKLPEQTQKVMKSESPPA